MNLTTLFARITRRLAQRRDTRAADYHSLLVEIADGNEPAAEAVERLLAEAGKTVDDLRSDVELLQRRRVLRGQVDALDSLQQERPAVEKGIEEANALTCGCGKPA